MPELDAWINFDATLQYWVENMSVLGGVPHQQSDLPQLLAQFWCTSTPEKWSSFLGLGLLGAASDGNREGIRQLLLAGANVRKRDPEGLNPLHRASLAGHADVVMELLAGKDDLGLSQSQQQRPLGNGQAPIGGLISTGGFPSNGRVPFNGGGLPLGNGGLPAGAGRGQPLGGGEVSMNEFSTLAWQTSSHGPRLEHSVSLLTKTIVNARDSVGSSPLHLAAARGNTNVVQVLLQNGADKSATDWLQRTPLHTASTCAVGSGIGSIQLLTKAGADVMARDNVGRTPLHDAACEGAEAAISVLVEAGAKTGARGSICSRTPLHEACARLREGSVKRLLDLGADESAVDGDGRTPGDMVGEWIRSGEMAFPGAEEFVREVLAAAPRDRTWRRRRLLVLVRWRRHRCIEKEEGKEDGEETSFGELQSLMAFAVGVQEGIFRMIMSYV